MFSVYEQLQYSGYTVSFYTVYIALTQPCFMVKIKQFSMKKEKKIVQPLHWLSLWSRENAED